MVVAKLAVFIVASAVVGLLYPPPTSAYSTGPPPESCTNGLKTGAPHGILEQIGNGSFVIATNLTLNKNSTSGGFKYLANQTYTVILVGAFNTFRGWIVQARVPGSENVLLGKFTPKTKFQSLLGCQDVEATVTHVNSKKVDFRRQDFTWQAPPEMNGTVEFYYTVVQTQQVFYTSLHASKNLVAMKDVAKLSKNGTAADTGLIFKIPSSCAASSCNVYVQITKDTSNTSVLNFHLQAKAKAWVAVGFTKTANMPSADVLACNRNPSTNLVEALDTYDVNVTYNNLPDTDQTDISLISGSYNNGRIICRFTRSIVGCQCNQDFNLNDKYYVLYGVGNNDPLAGHLLTHTGAGPNPSISAKKVNPLVDSGVQSASSFATISDILIKTHGVLMLVAWTLLAQTAAFFPMYMRPVLLKGEWFQVHRAFMLTSLFLGIVGFIVIFVSQAKSTIPGLITLGTGIYSTCTYTAHFAIGILVTFLQILNPLLSICRCKPNAAKRWIFNITHGYLVGLVALGLADANIGLGIYLYFSWSSEFGPIWFYVIYISLIALAFLIAFPYVQYVKIRRTRPKSSEEIELQSKEEKDVDTDGGTGGKSRKKFCLWLSLVLFLWLTLAVVIILSVLIVLAA